MYPSSRRPLSLLWSFIQRELRFRFAGSLLGSVWTILGPLLLLGIFSVVFSQLFTQRSDLGTENYTFYVALGLWPWMMFSDGLLRGMMAIQTNASIVKKIAFPHVLLVIAAVTSVFLQHLGGFVVVMLIFVATGTGNISVAGVPLAVLYLALLFAFTIGLSLLLASLQIFLRDIEQAAVPAIMMLHYLTPVLYPPSLIPASYRWLLECNPLALFVMRFRDCLLIGPSIQIADSHLLFATVLLLALGTTVFARLSPHFEDFL